MAKRVSDITTHSVPSATGSARRQRVPVRVANPSTQRPDEEAAYFSGRAINLALERFKFPTVEFAGMFISRIPRNPKRTDASSNVTGQQSDASRYVRTSFLNEWINEISVAFSGMGREKREFQKLILAQKEQILINFWKKSHTGHHMTQDATSRICILSHFQRQTAV